MNKLPKQYKNIAEFDILEFILNVSFEELETLIKLVQNEQFILTAKNVGLQFWGDTTVTNYNAVDILNKLRGAKTITKENLAIMVRDLLKQNVPVEITEHNSEYLVYLGIFDIGLNDIEAKQEFLRKELKMIIPSHIKIYTYFNNLIWLKFDDYDKSFVEWDNLDLSWEELEKYHE